MNGKRHSHGLLWAALAVLLLVGLYWGLKASLGVHESAGVQSRIYHLSVKNTDTVGDAPVFQAGQGDTLTFVIHSDRPGELHVHAYEEEKIELKPGGEVRLTFLAKGAGRFAIHLHDPDGSMHHLAILEVQPR